MTRPDIITGCHKVMDAETQDPKAERKRSKAKPLRLRDKIRVIGEHCAALPVLNPGSPEEILGYDEHGRPR
jgi:hypothetical protein